MSTRLHDAALRRLAASPAAAGDGAVRRISIEVDVAGSLETVIVSLRDGALQCVSSDGRGDGPHVRAALAFLTAQEPVQESLHPPISSTAVPAERQSEETELADALDDLLTAVMRIGIRGAKHAPSVDAALERLIDAAPKPTPPGLARFLGRLQRELGSETSLRIARILEGGSRLSAALREERPTLESKRRIDAWLGAQGGWAREIQPLYDRTMVEVGREWLSGVERASLERRYLIDVRTGAVYREDRPRNAVASLGPCPRELHVGLAEIEISGPAPRRVRVLQYEVEPSVRQETWEQLKLTASRSFSEMTEAYRHALRDEPALAEPFAVVRPYRIERNGVFKAFDAEGHQLVLDRSERRGAVLAFYELLSQGVELAWLAGRLTDTGATLCLTPFALGTSDGGYVRL